MKGRGVSSLSRVVWYGFGAAAVGTADQNKPMASTRVYEPDNGACRESSTTPDTGTRNFASDENVKPKRCIVSVISTIEPGRERTMVSTGRSTMLRCGTIESRIASLKLAAACSAASSPDTQIMQRANPVRAIFTDGSTLRRKRAQSFGRFFKECQRIYCDLRSELLTGWLEAR